MHTVCILSHVCRQHHSKSFIGEVSAAGGAPPNLHLFRSTKYNSLLDERPKLFDYRGKAHETLSKSKFMDVGVIEKLSEVPFAPINDTFSVHSSELNALNAAGMDTTDLAAGGLVRSSHQQAYPQRAAEELFSERERASYFGLGARRQFFQMYSRVKNQVETLHVANMPDSDDIGEYAGLSEGGAFAYLHVPGYGEIGPDDEDGYPDEDDKPVAEEFEFIAQGGRTPRRDFLRALHREQQRKPGLLPMPVLMRKITASRTLSLSGLGVGDGVVAALTRVLPHLPHLTELNLNDNRLTDAALTPLCKVAVRMPGLTALDLSKNDMDDAADVLREYLTEPNCSMAKLILVQSDIDDVECRQMMEAIEKNKSLTHLEIANNLIGSAEMLNVVNPDLVTGGEAIADMLQMNKTLQYLDVSWNTIRKESAEALGEALRYNKTLTTLKLAQNAFSDVASQQIGDSLAINESLTHLDLSFNAVTPSAAMVLANAFKTNAGLTQLNLDGNYLGKRGAESLLAAMRRAQTTDRYLHISIANCDVDTKTPDLFDPIEPTGRYVLDMTTPYARMVAAELLRLAKTRMGANFKKVEQRARGEINLRPIELVRGEPPAAKSNDWKPKVEEIGARLRACQNDGFILSSQKALLTAIKGFFFFLGLYPPDETVDYIYTKMKGEELEKNESVEDHIGLIFGLVFTRADSDLSGSIDVTEMYGLLRAIGQIDATEAKAAMTISSYDVDGSGLIEQEEFVEYLMGEYLTKPQVARGTILERNTGAEWMVPAEGFLVVQFVAEPMPPGPELVGSDFGIDGLINAIKSAKTDIDRVKVFDKAVTNSDIFLTAKQAQQLIKECGKGMDPFEMLVKLMPQMAGPPECCTLIDTELDYSLRLKLCVRLGRLFDVLCGNPTGFFALDLSDPVHRLTGKKIAELSNYERRMSKSASGRSDTSQKGNWENFRNEFVNDEREALTAKYFIKPPDRGHLKFDYVSTTRPRKGVTPMSVRRFIQLCRVLELDKLGVVKSSYNKLDVRVKRVQTFFVRHKEADKLVLGAGSNLRDPDGVFRLRRKDGSIGADDGDESESDSDEDHECPTPAQLDEDTTVGIPKASIAGLMGGNVLGLMKTAGLANKAAERLKGKTSVRGGVPAKGEMAHLASEDGSEHSKERHHSKYAHDLGPGYNVLGIEVPSHVHTKDMIEYWRTWRDSSYQHMEDEMMGYLGPEKMRDMAKVLGVDSAAGGTAGMADATLNDNANVAVAPPPPKKPASNPRRPAAGAQTGGAGGIVEGTVPGDEKNGDRPHGENDSPAKAFIVVYYKLIQLRVAVVSAWLSVDQALYIIRKFPSDDMVRVQATITLFGRIVDMENFMKIPSSMSRMEELELYHRLGWLNTTNPMLPDRYYELDLRFWEQREICKVLCTLAVEEPGENWIGEDYRWSKGDTPVPGWELPASWAASDEEFDGEGGPRRFGRLRCRYTSDPDRGCDPVWGVRRDLMARFLCGTVRVF